MLKRWKRMRYFFFKIHLSFFSTKNTLFCWIFPLFFSLKFPDSFDTGLLRRWLSIFFPSFIDCSSLNFFFRSLVRDKQFFLTRNRFNFRFSFRASAFFFVRSFAHLNNRDVLFAFSPKYTDRFFSRKSCQIIRIFFSFVALSLVEQQ